MTGDVVPYSSDQFPHVNCMQIPVVSVLMCCTLNAAWNSQRRRTCSGWTGIGQSWCSARCTAASNDGYVSDLVLSCVLLLNRLSNKWLVQLAHELRQSHGVDYLRHAARRSELKMSIMTTPLSCHSHTTQHEIAANATCKQHKRISYSSFQFK